MAKKKTTKRVAAPKKPWSGAVVSYSALKCEQPGSEVDRLFIGDVKDSNVRDHMGMTAIAAAERAGGQCLIAVGECGDHRFICAGDEAIQQLAEFLANAVGMTLTPKAK